LSHDQGRRLARHHTPGHPGRPALDRPSLFAADDAHNSVLDDDTQRVRILSTLESARRPVRMAPSKARRLQRQGSGWQVKALLGLMGAGVIALLTSFVLVVVDGHTTSTQVEAAMVEQAAKSGQMTVEQPAPASAALTKAVSTPPPSGKQADKATAKPDANNPLAALIAPAAAPPSAPASPKAVVQSTPQTAVIETVLGTAPTPTAPPLAAHSASAAAVSVRGKAAPKQAEAPPARAGTTALSPSPSTMAGATAHAPAATVAVAKTAPTANTRPDSKPDAAAPKAGTAPGTKPPIDTLALQRGLNVPPAPGKNARNGNQGANSRNDEDVALLEAMFAHTGSRKAPVSVAEEIKRQCSQLAGAEAATCRARLCVQNPTAPVCHPEP
jgi:hypothetical protein